MMGSFRLFPARCQQREDGKKQALPDWQHGCVTSLSWFISQRLAIAVPAASSSASQRPTPVVARAAMIRSHTARCTWPWRFFSEMWITPPTSTMKGSGRDPRRIGEFAKAKPRKGAK